MPIYNTFAIHLPRNAYLVKFQGDREEVDLKDAELTLGASARVLGSDLKNGVAAMDCMADWPMVRS